MRVPHGVLLFRQIQCHPPTFLNRFLLYVGDHANDFVQCYRGGCGYIEIESWKLNPAPQRVAFKIPVRNELADDHYRRRAS
jgi:hypothetical protein